MSYPFNTASVLIAGMAFITVYFIVYFFQNRLDKVNLTQFGMMFILPFSIMGSMELIYRTMMLLNDDLMERDKIFTVLGALFGLFLSFKSFLKILTITKTSTVQQA